MSICLNQGNNHFFEEHRLDDGIATTKILQESNAHLDTQCNHFFEKH